MSMTPIVDPAVPDPEQLARDFEREVLPHVPLLWRRARRMARTPQDAEDLVQSTLERAYRHFARRPPEVRIWAWLAVILTRLAIDGHRHHARAPNMTSLDDPQLAFGGRGKRVGWSPSEVEAEMLDRLEAAAILEAIGRLPPRYRPVLSAVAEALPYEEIARRTGIPVGTVKSRLARGRRQLHQLRPRPDGRPSWG
jgi:RNA polymerase sigma-70 factor (ECF subfamily)